ncbi:Uncharacterized protein Adt_10018 [Abeliophyllum distichum]|uniref:Uncharacterized protein n=1 Tax=Abeliophyllum distichum TaxID=126358 RepID=A0ABD1UIT5_9LAMI
MDKEEQEEAAGSMWDCGSPLYDAYELVSFAHFIDRHTMVLPSSVLPAQFESSTTKRHMMVLPSPISSDTYRSNASASSEEEITTMKMKKFSHTKGKKDKVTKAKSKFYSLFARIGL